MGKYHLALITSVLLFLSMSALGSPAVEIVIEYGNTKEQSCINSGGVVGTASCCLSYGDFPNTCLSGTCGCSPTNSHNVNVCDCGLAKCFDGNTCVSSTPTSSTTTTTTTPEGENTITLRVGQNIIGVPGLTESSFANCELLNFESITRPGCTYDDRGYLVYYNPLGNKQGDCLSDFFSTGIMMAGYGYYLYASQQCDVSFDSPSVVQVTLYPNKQNIISVPVVTSLDDIASVCGDRASIFENFQSITYPGCVYDDNGYFIYYDTAGSANGDCGSRFKSEASMRPFVGYYVYFKGKNGDGATACSFRYENGIISQVL